MSFTAWLDVAIGLAVVYLGASLFVTIIGEWISHLLNLRGRALYGAVQGLLASVKDHAPLVANPALKPFLVAQDLVGRNGVPSYVDPVVVARALLAPGADAKVAELLEGVVGPAGASAEQAVAAVSHWVDSSLAVLSEQFKRRQRWVTVLVAAAVAIALNLDTLALTTRLYRDKEARDATVAVALDVNARTDREAFARCYALDQAGRERTAECAPMLGLVTAVRGSSAALGTLPIGWGAVSEGEGAEARLLRSLGWLLTTLALSLGAPFWFDLLGRFVNLRSGIGRPDVSAALAASGAAPPGPTIQRAGSGPARVSART